MLCVCIDACIVCTHIAVSYPTRIMCISHNNSNDMCTELLPVKSLVGSDHPLEEQVTNSTSHSNTLSIIILTVVPLISNMLCCDGCWIIE